MNMTTVQRGLLLTTLVLGSFFPASSHATPLYACAHKANGHLRLIATPGQCHQTEREVTWDDSHGLQTHVNALLGRVTLLEQAVGVLNDAPTVNAGPDQATLLSLHAMLNGSVSDDGILEPATHTWTQGSGPGVAVFDNPSGEDTGVTFDAIGEYVLRLTASDGLVLVSDEVIVRVFPDNHPPVVDAGADQTLTGTTSGSFLTCSTVVVGTATDDGFPGPLTVLWSGGTGVVDSGAGKGGGTSGSFLDEHALSTSVTLQQAGTGGGGKVSPPARAIFSNAYTLRNRWFPRSIGDVNYHVSAALMEMEENSGQSRSG